MKKKKPKKKNPFKGQRVQTTFSTLTKRIADKKKYNRKRGKRVKPEELD